MRDYIKIKVYINKNKEEYCCYRCGRGGHYIRDCYATYHIKGYYIRD